MGACSSARTAPYPNTLPTESPEKSGKGRQLQPHASSSEAETEPGVAEANAEEALITQTVSAAAKEGVVAVIKLMKQQEASAAYQAWCCDALAGLCAGNEDARALVHVHHGALLVLGAMKLFQWDEAVQVKAFWAITNIAASFADYLGKLGTVEAVAQGMIACRDDYQVQTMGTKCIGVLISNCVTNLARAKKYGLGLIIKSALNGNKEDGQLQWRGMTVLKQMESFRRASIIDSIPPPSRQSPWSLVRDAVYSGKAKGLAQGNLPGLQGKSKLVARTARQGGVAAVLSLMKATRQDAVMLMWCCDAISSITEVDEDSRTTLFLNDGLTVILDSLRSFRWDSELCTRALAALASMSSSHALEISRLNGLEAATTAMEHNLLHYQAALHFVRLAKNLLGAGPEVVDRARACGVASVCAALVAGNEGDGMLLWRVNGVLKVLAVAEIPSTHDLLRDAMSP